MRYQKVLLVALALILVQCGDPGYRMAPVGWESTTDQIWAKQYSGFEIRTYGIHGLTGEWSIDPSLDIWNSKVAIITKSAYIISGDTKIAAEIYDNRPVPPSTSGYHLPVAWEFEGHRRATEVLGQKCEIVINLEVDGKDQQIEINFQRNH